MTWEKEKSNFLYDKMKSILTSYGISLSEEKTKLIVEYLSLLLEAPMNLSGIEEFEEAVHKHVADVLLPTKMLQGNLLDVGTGGGIPGLILSIAYPVKSVLVDSSRKKTIWLEKAVEKLNLKNVEVVCSRVESLGETFRETFDYVTARAVAPLRVLLELCVPFCKVKGILLLYKGPNWMEEMKESRNALKVLNVQLEEKIEYKLFTGENRVLLKFRKLLPTDPIYPRETRKIIKRPL
ncbi:16S rRNA (guanine(527)-N(7))-methyltransferase RsmG [Pseudothermotoga sp.]|uniref:16S rRNA (guanine(527)-N(7))-methyltransferase RsmG n=1 Tax=Pseudothermotoga sp. TaxID=2033661 RepID=UPI0031F71075